MPCGVPSHVCTCVHACAMQGEHLGEYMAAHPAKFKERVRKGIPEELRGLSWQLLSGMGYGLRVGYVS